MLTALVVPTLNNFEGLTTLLQSARSRAGVQPVVMDNWNHNHGVAKAWNAGIKISQQIGCEFALICNDDIILQPDTIDRLVDDMRNHTEYDLITPLNTRDANILTGESVFDGHPDFSCFMVHVNTFVEAYGWFDENIWPAYHEDNDMAYRMLLSGGQYARDLSIGFYHAGSVTQNKNVTALGGVVSHSRFRELQQYYIAKWGGLPGHEIYIVPWNDSRKALKDW